MRLKHIEPDIHYAIAVNIMQFIYKTRIGYKIKLFKCKDKKYSLIVVFAKNAFLRPLLHKDT